MVRFSIHGLPKPEENPRTLNSGYMKQWALMDIGKGVVAIPQLQLEPGAESDLSYIEC